MPIAPYISSERRADRRLGNLMRSTCGHCKALRKRTERELWCNNCRVYFVIPTAPAVFRFLFNHAFIGNNVMTSRIILGKSTRFLLLVLLLLPFAAAGTAQAGSTYADKILSEEGLLAYYRFDQDTGVTGSTAVDAVGTNAGQYIGNVIMSAAGEGAPVGDAANKAVNFQGINSVISVGRLLGFAPSMYSGATVEMWVKATSGLDDGDQAPLGVLSSTSSKDKNNLFINLDERPNGDARDNRIRVYDGNASGADFDTEVTDGQWTYLAVAINFGNIDPNERLKIYIAKPGDTVSTEYTPATEGTPLVAPELRAGPAPEFAVPMYLGAINQYNTGAVVTYEGMLDEVAFYTKMLSKEQIDSHLASVPEPSLLVVLASAAFCLLISRKSRIGTL